MLAVIGYLAGHVLAASFSRHEPPRILEMTNETSHHDDDRTRSRWFGRYSTQQATIGAVALCTVIAAPCSFVTAVAGLAAGSGRPLNWPPEHLCLSKRFPCHWEPLTLLRACSLYALIELGLAAVSLALPMPWTLVGGIVNGACFGLNALAAKLLYLPRYRLRQLLRTTHT